MFRLNRHPCVEQTNLPFFNFKPNPIAFLSLHSLYPFFERGFLQQGHLFISGRMIPCSLIMIPYWLSKPENKDFMSSTTEKLFKFVCIFTIGNTSFFGLK